MKCIEDNGVYARKLISLFVCIFLLGACGKKSELPAMDATSSQMRAAPAVYTEQSEAQVASNERLDIKRYIAMRHHIVVESSNADLETNFNRVTEQCLKLKCQIMTAEINRDLQYGMPNAHLAMRLPPKAFEQFFAGLSKTMQVVQHRRESEDKTNQVIDADAQIKNLTELRNRLRALLASHPANIKDLIEIERQLADTQAQLDTMMGTRKLLALETEMIEMDIAFQSQSKVTESGFFAPIFEAWDNAGHLLMNSFAGLISFVAVMIPWLMIIIPGAIFLVRVYRRYKNKKITNL
jgi:hypothetical protein